MNLYEQFEDAHLPQGVDGSRTIRLTTFLEKQVRFASCLIMATLASEPEFRTRLPRMTGLGGYLGFLRHCVEEIGVASLDQGLANLAAQIDSSLSQQVTLDKDGLTVKQFRDYVAHAGFVPGDGRFDSALRAAVKENSQLLSDRIGLMGGTRLLHGLYLLGDIPLSPLFIHRGGAPAMFQELNKKEATYYSVAEDVLVYKVGLTTNSELSGLLDLVPAKPDRDGSAVRLFKDAVIEDLRGFAVPGSASTSGLFSPFSVKWQWVTSSGHEDRKDTFRLGIRNEWQWLSGRSWQGYDSFLRTIANWAVVAQRSLLGLEARINHWEDAEKRLLRADRTMSVPRSVESQLARRDISGGSIGGEWQGVRTLAGMLDDSAGQVSGRPTIYFITGEAGIGKTFSLLHLTRQRASALRAEPADGSPLYLYVSCSGTGLKRLKDLINAEVAETRNLVYESVMCMCRNGLLVLVVDGFDELIGGAGYRDAFDQLEPLLADLGDRGTIVLSARSAYLANQYRGSIELHARSAGQQVRHQIYELQRWSNKQVDELFTANAHWGAFREKLSTADFALLGVPFFARAFNSYATRPDSGKHFTSLRQVLVDSYLERETTKLGRPGGERPVGRDQLSAVLEEIASELHYSGQAALTLDEFKLACAAGLNLEVDGRSAALLDRLTVLCGIAADLSGDEGHQFAFEHEIFGEVFLGRYASRAYLEQTGQFGSKVVTWFGRSVLGSACVETLVTKAESSRVVALVQAISQGDLRQAVLSANLLSLITECRKSGLVLPALSINNGDLDEVDLLSDSRLDLNLTECSISLLRIGAKGAARLELRSVRIDQLEVSANEGDLDWFGIDASVDIAQMFAQDRAGGGAKFASDDGLIADSLRRLGVRGVSISEMTVSSKSAEQCFGEAILEGMRRTGDARYIVEDRGLIPGGSGGHGVHRPYSKLWRTLTRALVASGLAVVRPLNAAGVAKSWVTLTLDPDLILSGADHDPRIVAFWGML